MRYGRAAGTQKYLELHVNEVDKNTKFYIFSAWIPAKSIYYDSYKYGDGNGKKRRPSESWLSYVKRRCMLSDQQRP